MRVYLHVLLVVLGLAACVALEVAAFAASASDADIGPFLVIAAPWGPTAEAVVVAAGGQFVGPSRAPLSILATDVTVPALRAAGAWDVLDAQALANLCGLEIDL